MAVVTSGTLTVVVLSQEEAAALGDLLATDPLQAANDAFDTDTLAELIAALPPSPEEGL